MAPGWSQLSYADQVAHCETAGLLTLTDAERALLSICARVTDDLTSYEELLATWPTPMLEALGQLLMKVGAAQRQAAERYQHRDKR